MNIQKLLTTLKEKSTNNREQGTYFETLMLDFLQNDRTYAPQFSEVTTFKDWAENQGIDGNDIGIDLVAKNADDDLYTAIQCKFYGMDGSINKKDIDSFIAASDRRQFNRRLFIDTTKNGIGKNVETEITNSKTPFTRIGLAELKNSSIDWEQYQPSKSIALKQKKTLRPHQQEALSATIKGLVTDDRGKLIMACGTGKTFTALKIAEHMAGKNKRVLFLAPSLSLISQTVTEWTIESDNALHAFAVCSDVQVGKRKASNDDLLEINAHDLAYPATTDPEKLAQKYNINNQDKMTVVFATYQSIGVISKAQKQHGIPEFDLIICDEAHRTTGATLEKDTDSNFVKIHNQDVIAGKKRIYMTATPRVYITKIKEVADEKNATLYSMDDKDVFGKELYTLKFGEAVEQKLLSDYKVLVLALDEETVASDIQKRLADSENKLNLDEATKIIGCYKALAKAGISDTEGAQPMRKAVAFCKDIKSSKLFRDEFGYVVDEYLSHQNEAQENNQTSLACDIQHVDGTMNTAVRNASLSWLKETTDDACRILTNARCLSEGVDVPSLDAVLFVHSRRSKVDIVQSVGRVMRRAEGKKLGYVILPIVIPAGVEADKALKNNKNYEIVWDVLNALRSHDERLDADINQVRYGGLPSKMEILSEVDTLPNKDTTRTSGVGGDGDTGGDHSGTNPQIPLDYQYDSVQKAILSKIVDKCGTRTYWETWASDIAEIATKHIARINAILTNKQSDEYKAFEGFLKELQENVNNSITADEVVEMLAQHIITKPVFDALFSDYDFTNNNPVSKSIQSVLDVLNKHHIDSETKGLEKFYQSVKRRVDGIDTAYGKQKIVVELYDKFFQVAFPKMAERLGIVYTPVECVDFIIKSVNDVLQSEFGQSLADKNTHIIDPFTGTGTFITRLIQSGLIPKDQLAYKFQNELHANEIVLLAYYIATINIETTYHDAINQDETDQSQYQPFDGICLTDTFQLYENNEDLITPQLPINSARLNKQKNLDIKVIIGNPPYSAGQKSGNDNNQNIGYKKLDASIENTYAKHSTATLKNSLYDSYIRAIRWASDRIGDTGVIGFITNSGWLESNSSDGMRKTLKDEFSKLYIFNLKGAIRGKSGDIAKREGQSIFDIITGVAITILVKNPQAKTNGNIYFHDIGDYLNQNEKLNIIKTFGSINGISQQNSWQEIKPDKYHDWLNQRDDSFYQHIAMGDKKDTTKQTIFENYSNGLKTNRDAWVYNSSKTRLEQNIKNMIGVYNQELERYSQSEAKKNQPSNKKEAEKYIAQHINANPKKIAYSRDFRYDVFDNAKKQYTNCLNSALYRPFTKTNAYYHGSVMMELYQMPKIFPEAGLDNLVIGVSGKRSAGIPSSCLISNYLTDLEFISKSQCFPFKLYEPITANDANKQDSLLTVDDEMITANSGMQYTVKDGISDAVLKHFTDYYQADFSKEDLFYYIYGLLHSPDYKKRFANNLVKDLPHIPRLKKLDDFYLFSKAGRSLADLHLNYENKEPYQAEYKQGKAGVEMMADDDFYVEKMKFGANKDKSMIIYNNHITLQNIPLKAYEYVVNGKSAIEWVMDRQRVSTHKDSGITNNANDWAKETMNNPRYPLDLLLRVITVSLETVDIVESLPDLEFG